MAQIEVRRDPQIELSPIVHTLYQPGTDEDPDLAKDNPTEIQQTKVSGILVPIIALNNIAVDFKDVIEFTLDYTENLPSVKFRIVDRSKIFSQYTQPGNDNELRVQILPQHDNTYKKIDLVFVCGEISVEGDEVTGEASYKLKELTKSQFKSFGPKTTYELFDQVSTDTGLGFATNVDATEDSRYMECRFESYKDLVSREIERSDSGADHVYDWWVDVWNNLILCDLYDRIQSEDEEEDMMVWITGNPEQNASTNTESETAMHPAIFTNHPIRENTDLFVHDYDVQNEPASQGTGNTIALSVYEENKHEYVDHYIADGDIDESNEFVQYEYAGEVYGDYNYLLADKAREVYIKKIKSEVIVLHVSNPMLSINRGDQCRFVWYEANGKDLDTQENLEELGAIKTSEELGAILGWVKDWDIPRDEGNATPLRINMQFSGQYTCIGQYITYNRESMSWDCWLYLTRPADKRPKIINVESEEIKQ